MFLKELLVLGKGVKQQTPLLMTVLFSTIDEILFLEESLVCLISFFSSAVKDFHVYPEQRA